ncbi:hypothetical protein OMF39_01650, partial [Bordetella pertussis]
TGGSAISSFSNPVRMNHAYNLLNLHRWPASPAGAADARRAAPNAAGSAAIAPRKALRLYRILVFPLQK